jgi:monoamine oxidase
LKNYIEGYYAGETSKASSFAVRDELNSSTNKQYRPEGGYSKMIDFLYQKCIETRVTILLSEPVTSIDYSKELIKVTSVKDFVSHKTLITIPIGVLQKNEIMFTPSISEKVTAATKLGYGPVIKTILQFESAFWKSKEYTQQKNLDTLSFIFSESIIPTWWTQYPEESNIITGWSGGPHALKLKELSDEEIAEEAIISLTEIFEIDIIKIRQSLKGWHVYNWVKDKYSYGGYSYEVVNGKEYREKVLEPVRNKLFFAGEGLYDGPEIGTVEAALITGREAAHTIISKE